MLVGQLLPDGTASDVVAIPGALAACLGLCSCWWMPPPLRPRWYRAQYTPLLRRRRR